MSRTYSRGKYKRAGHKYGHCFICGWDPKFSMSRRTKRSELLKFDIDPFLNSE